MPNLRHSFLKICTWWSSVGECWGVLCAEDLQRAGLQRRHARQVGHLAINCASKSPAPIHGIRCAGAGAPPRIQPFTHEPTPAEHPPVASYSMPKHP